MTCKLSPLLFDTLIWLSVPDSYLYCFPEGTEYVCLMQTKQFWVWVFFFSVSSKYMQLASI